MSNTYYYINNVIITQAESLTRVCGVCNYTAFCGQFLVRENEYDGRGYYA